MLFMQGLQDKIELVPIDLKNRPAWYKEKVYPANKVKSFFFLLCFMIWFDCYMPEDSIGASYLVLYFF